MKTDSRKKELLRSIPQVDALLLSGAFEALREEFSPTELSGELKELLDRKRAGILKGEIQDAEALLPEALAQEVAKGRFDKERILIQPVINASGIVLHTNLGRAPLGEAMAKKLYEELSSYSNLEYRLDLGRRGSRYDALEALFCELTGAEGCLVVNNNAGAVLLVLAELCRGQEVIVSRSELVEIGGAFRVPEVMEQGGAILHEIGCTNKVRPSDYERAVNERTGGLLKVHRSNFRLEGFTEEVSLSEMKEIADRAGVPLIYDLGSGLLHPDPPACLRDEPTVAGALREGADVVCFSGDKLLGGPQAGIILGKKEYIERVKTHPLTRALRCDKMTLFVLQEIARIYRDPERIKKEIPLFSMLEAEPEALLEKAGTLVKLLEERGIPSKVLELSGEVGGGSAPGVRISSFGAALDPQEISFDLEAVEKRLRLGRTPVIGYVKKDLLLFDVRTVQDAEMEPLADAIAEALEEGKDA